MTDKERDISNKYDGTMSDKEWFQYFWNYFELMSNQRLKMLSFYITVEVVLFGGFFNLIRLKTRISFAEWFVVLMMLFMSILFFGLDYRTKNMIHKCEDLMARYEKDYINKDCPEDRFLIHYINKQDETLLKNITYGRWIFLQFITISLVSIGIMILLVLKKI